MDKASRALRRGGIRLRSRSSGHGDLNLIINQIKEVRNSHRGFVTAQATLFRDLQRWACREDNRALQDSFTSILELSCIWEEVQRGISDKTKEFRTHFEMILDGERQLDSARSLLNQCEQQELKLKKELKRLAKRRDVSVDERKCLEAKLTQAERQKDIAQLEFHETLREIEEVKMIRIKNALLHWSDAFVSMGTKCQYIHKAQTTIAHQIPDVLSSCGVEEMKFTGAGRVKLAVQEAKENVRVYDESRRRTGATTSELFASLQESPPPPYSSEPVRSPPEYSYTCPYPEPTPYRFENFHTDEPSSRLQRFAVVDGARSLGLPYPGDEASALVLENFAHSDYRPFVCDNSSRPLTRADSIACCGVDETEEPRRPAPAKDSRSKSCSWVNPAAQPAQKPRRPAGSRLYPDLTDVMSNVDLSGSGSGARCKSRLSEPGPAAVAGLGASQHPEPESHAQTGTARSAPLATCCEKAFPPERSPDSDPEDISGAIGGLSLSKSFHDQ